MTAEEIEQLRETLVRLQQAGENAEVGLCVSMGTRVSIREAKYAGQRAIVLGGPEPAKAIKITMSAVSIETQPGHPRDVMFCRTPELAKFIAQLVNTSDEIVTMLLRGIAAASGAEAPKDA